MNYTGRLWERSWRNVDLKPKSSSWDQFKEYGSTVRKSAEKDSRETISWRRKPTKTRVLPMRRKGVETSLWWRMDCLHFTIKILKWISIYLLLNDQLINCSSFIYLVYSIEIKRTCARASSHWYHSGGDDQRFMVFSVWSTKALDQILLEIASIILYYGHVTLWKVK